MDDTAPRAARPEDADHIADLHVRAWAETYADLLPAPELARNSLAARRTLWRAVLVAPSTRVAVLPGAGFACMGPQRDTARSADHPEEPLALYVLRTHHGRGIGRALLGSVRDPASFTAWVLSGNARALAFYRRSGGHEIGRRSEILDGMDLTEILISFPTPPDGA